MTDILRPSSQMPRAPEKYDVRDQVELRRAVQMALDSVAVATGNPKISLAAGMGALPAATAVAATDKFLNLTAAGVAQTSTGSLIRDYVLTISGGTATIAENLTVTGALTANGNVVLGNASGDTLTVAPNAVTWSNNPTHSGNHTFSGNVTVTGTGVFGGMSVTRASGLPLSLNAGVSGGGVAHVLTRMQNTAATADIRTWDFRISVAGAFEVRSVVDTGSTVVAALSIAHASGNVTLVGSLGGITTLTAQTVVATTRVTTPLLGTTTATDVVIDRNSVTQLTLGSLSATFAGGVGVTSGLIVNESGGDNDTRIEGDTDTNLVFVDASTDRVGIGNATPGYKFDVSGTVNTTDAYRVDGTQVVGNQGAAVTDPAGGAVIDAESRTAIIAIIDRLQAHGLIA